LEQGIALYDPQEDIPLVSVVTQDPGVSCLSVAAFALWHLGYPDQARKRSHEALTLARELARPYGLAFTLSSIVTLHQFCREVQAVQEQAEAVIALCTDQGFPFQLALGTIHRGWALAAQGQGEEGIVQMRQSLAAVRATGAELFRPFHLSLLAETYRDSGQIEEGLAVLAEALAVVDKTGERASEAELYRLKGELTLKQSGIRGPESEVQREAEACFRKAIEISRRQQAKSLELRAVISLSRLWQHQGKREDARQLLAEIYNWFTEGFDTKDLQEAKALLEEVA
jgi:predicted ATPase